MILRKAGGNHGTGGARADGRGGIRRHRDLSRIRKLGVEARRVEDPLDMHLLLEHRLEQRKLETRIGMEAHRAGGHIFGRAAEHERVQQVVGDEVPGRGEVIGPPRGCDLVAQVPLESRACQGHVAEH